MASKMTRAEKERRQAAKQNEKAKKKEEAKKGKSNSSSSLNLPKLFDEPKEKKSFAQRFAEDTKKLDIGNKREERAAAKEKKTRVSDRSWRNPMTKTGVSMPDNIDVTRGNSGRTREEMDRRTSQRELSQMNPDKWMKTSRETVGLKDNEKAGVGLGTIQHGTLNKNAELFSSNWDLIPQGSRVDAAIQIIYTYGINDQNRDMVMSAFNGASTYDKRKIMDAAVQTVGWNDVTYGMKQAVNNAPDAKEALMQQISEDMNVRNGNYLDTFKREASKAVVDQYNLQRKEDKIITDWAKENYGLGEAIKMATLEKGGSLVNGLTDSVAFGVSDLLQIGQQDNVLDGVNPFEGVKNTEGFGNKIARVGTNVLHDLFRLTGINVSLFSKAFLNEREVREITDALTGITDPYYEAVRNNMVALEGSNLSESQKTAVEIYGAVVEQIPSIVMAVVASPAAGLATTGVTAGGKYARSAYEQGATLEEAVRFGLAGAATEVATEKMFTGFGYFGKGAASKVLNETTKKMLQQSAFPNSMSARILKRVVAGGGEASEEMIAELVQPFLERSTYDPAADNATLEEVLRSGGIGFAVAQILGLPANALGVTADVLQAYDTKAQERVINDNLRKMVTEGLENGRIDEATAANINAQVSDIRKGKGVLTQSEAKEETKTTGENLDKVYSDFDEAREAMKAEAKGMKNGETVRARVMKDGEVKTWETEVVNGSISPLVRESVLFGNEKVAYNEKAKRVASATNTAERTGYQLNVKDEIVKEVSALSKAFNREVEFYYDENSAVHGNVDLNTGKIYVNVNSSQSPAAAVIAHEMTHLLENTSSYKTLTNMMQKYYASSLEDKRNEIIAIYKSNPKAMKTILDENDKIKMDVIDSEVMAAFIEEKLLTDYNTIRELTRTDRTLAQKIVDWINKVIQKITGSKEQRFLIEARDVWNKALKEGKTPATSTEGEQITSDTVEEIRYSQGNDKKLMDKADARNHATHAVEQEILDEAREARTNIKDKYSDLFIADSVSERKSPLVGNDSYAGSLDSTTICSRSLTLEAIVELVAKKFDRPLTNAEAIVVAQELMEYTGDRAECLYCYQANAKRGYEDALGAFIRERRTVIDNHRNGMDKDTNFKLMMNFNFEKGTWGKKPTDAAKDRFNTYIKIAEGKLAMAPASGMLNTRTLYASIADKKNSPAIIEQYKQARTYAQGAVKAHGRVYYAVYNGQVLRVKQEKIDEWNRTYGLRMYSFSDFSPAFILENMQMVTDAAVRGLRMLAYTKEPEFVSIFGDTGMAINISVAGVPDGNGGYHSDGMQGMDWEQAKTLRILYPTAGTVYVAKDDAEVEWAMSQDWIDTVIPFHISYGSGMMQRSMGWTNYSGQQSEKKMPGWTKELKTTIYPSEHQNDKETYLRLCEENLLTPKFPKWKDHPDYMKLVNETRLAPEEMAPVQPVFNVEAASATLWQFAKAGGYNPILGGSEANRDYIVEDIAERVKERAPEVEARDRRFSIGKPTDTKAERKKQNRLDEATMREFDRLMKQRSEDERKDAEATMRMHDKLIKEVYNEAKALSAEEKREIRKNVKEEDKERMKKELASRAAKYRKERSNARKNLNEVLKEAEKQRKDYERKLAAPEKEAMRKQQKEVDAERRKERIRTAKEEYKRNAPKPAEGTTESLYFKNKNARKLITQFRRNVIGYLVEHGKFVETNGEVVLDENGVEIAYRNENDEWEISKHKNTYTPSWGLTLLAEKEGMDKDVFFTIYSKIADMKTKRDKNGNFVYKKKDITDYIISLNLNQKQKEFLYFDAAKFPYSKMPVFLPGGRVNEKAGNTRGRMVEALDNIAIDMFAGTMNDDYFESQQIREKDINAFVDAVFGKEESQERDDFALFLTGSIIDYSAQMETVRLQERTKLLTDKPKEKNNVKMQILRAYRESKRLFVAEGEAFERMGEKLKNPLITARYYGAKKSSAIANEMIYGKTQRDLKGEKQGKSLYEIFKPVFRADEEAGNNDNMTELTELVNCRHDIYRLRNGKGYTGYSIEECEKIVDRISREHSELLKVADEIAEYGRNLLRMCVESGRISEADFDYFTAKYPYYAPTFRLRSNEYIDRKGNVVRRDTKVIRTAVGGNDDVLPLFDQFVRRTQEIVKACKKNQLASELARSFTMPQSAEYIKDVRKSEKQEDKEKEIASIGEVEDIGRARKEDGNENIIPWYSNGKKYDIEVEDTALLHGWDRITFRYNEAMIATAFRKMNNIRRGILTQYNPTFWLTNGIKDIQDMYLYNQHAQRLPKFHLEAAKTMFAGTFGKGKNEEALEEYLSFGMSQASIFEYDNTNSGRRTKRARVNEALRKPIDAFNGLNFMVEQTPRLAVYMETMDRLEKQRKNGGNTYTDEEIKTIAAYQASDATLNFGRGGTVVKAANTYGMTFLNAGVQGMDRFRRMFTQVKDGNKRAMIINICGLIMKLGIVGVGWNVLTDWIYGGDDEYAKAIREALYEDDADKIAQEYNEMADYQRTNYLLLNINGVWVRIPKGRLASFVYGFVYNGEKVYSGEMDALDLISAQMDLASETILFSNPITNNIFGPFVDVWRNKDAWDVEIVSEYEDMGEGFHYLESDEETTDLAIAIAEFGHYLTADLFGVESSRILDISPKKLDYLIEQYLGSYANVIMPFLSKEQNLKDNAIGALTEIIRKFYIDPTSSNRLAGDYYDLKEEFENIANAHEGDSPYAVASKVFGDYTKELKALRDEINAIGADTSLSRKERLEQISELREQMNELYRQGILDAKDALGFAHANYYGKDGNSDLYEDWQKTSKGADWVVTTMSDTAQEQFALVEKDGVDAENFVNAYTFINNATADKDENGKSINGSKKEKIVNYLNSLDLTAEQKMSLYTNVAGYKVSDRAPAPSFVNGALIQPSTSNMAAPIAGGGRMTSGYGWRNCPFHGREFHQAVDIAAESGTDVGAVISGTVTMATVHGEYGNSIEITSTDENGNTVVTKYNHLLNMGVEVGDVINQGTKIGEVGSTGSSTGAHLDFRLKINNDWVDPTQYIDLESSGVVDATGYTQKEGSGGSASSGGYSGRSGGSSGGSDRKASTASTPRAETKYDSVTKISGASSGGSSYSGGGVMLPTASEIAQINSRTVSGRSTKSATYGAKGSYLPKANSTPQHNLGTSVATTQRTGRTGGSMWDENLLS